MKAPNQERWLALWHRSRLSGNAVACFEQLMECYSQSHRAYHNQFHIAECLREFEAARLLAVNPDAVELAIWFHDAIYDSRAPDNEARSADFATEQLHSAGASNELVQNVKKLIAATKHTVLPTKKDEQLLVDVDLSILGQSEERFAEYESQIRREYDWVPKEVFNLKRAEVLERFLSRPFIYSTEPFRSKYEDRARQNLRASIRNLRCGE